MTVPAELTLGVLLRCDVQLLLMGKKKIGDEIDALIGAKFAEYDVVDRKNDSPNARHYVLQKSGLTKHLKVVKKSYIDANDYSEIALLRSINSDHVIKLEDYGDVNEDYYFLIFPHINGQTLDRMHIEGGWSEDSIKALCKDVLQGLEDLKKSGIVHRDIKPKNIIYDNVNKKYIILDLGIGYFIEGPNKDNTKVPKGVGPMFYSAPEQFKIAIGELYSVTQATDQFSFGAILYELACDAHPFIEFNKEKAQSYATLVMDENLPKPLSPSPRLSKETCAAVERMLAKEPSERYLSLNEIKQALGFEIDEEGKCFPGLYLKMPHQDKDEFIAFVQENISNVAGVVLSASDSAEYANKLDELNIPILFDPKTYNLQINESTDQLSNKLGIPYSSAYSILSLYKLKDELLDGTYQLSKLMLSSKVVLPYFNVEGAGTDYLKFTKEIWFDAKRYYSGKGLDDASLYGALIVPYSVIRSAPERTKLMSQLSANYPLDGIVVTFENADKSILTTVDDEYLKGLRQLCAFFEATFNEVIVHHTDLSVLPLCSSISYTTGWSKKSRHFNMSATGGNGKNRVYKMKLYASKLFTFIEEKSNVQTIVLLGKSDYLKCDCPDCKANDPLDDSYKPNETHEKRHFFKAMVKLHSQLNGLTPSQRKAFFKQYIQECEDAGTDIKSTGVIGSKTIPSYKGLISLIND